MKHEKRLGSVIQTAVALLLCLATVLCVTQLQIGHAPQEEAHATSRMLLSQGEVLYDGDRIAGMDSANDGEDQEMIRQTNRIHRMSRIRQRISRPSRLRRRRTTGRTDGRIPKRLMRIIPPPATVQHQGAGQYR